MIIKRVDLKKLKINGAECKFDKAELIIRREEIHVNPNNMYVDQYDRWDIEVLRAKCHVNFTFLFNFDIEANLEFETFEGDKVKAKGIIDGVTSVMEKYEELDITVKDWEVAV